MEELTTGVPPKLDAGEDVHKVLFPLPPESESFFLFFCETYRSGSEDSPSERMSVTRDLVVVSSSQVESRRSAAAGRVRQGEGGVATGDGGAGTDGAHRLPVDVDGWICGIVLL